MPPSAVGGDEEEHLYFPVSSGLPIQPCTAVPSLPMELTEHRHLMVLHLAQCFVLREDRNPHPPHLPWAKTEDVWVGSMDAAQFCGALQLEHHPIFIGNQSLYLYFLRRGLQSWNAIRNTIRSHEKSYFFSLKLVTCTVFTVVFLVGMVLLMSLERH